jgi:hypothetical protein
MNLSKSIERREALQFIAQSSIYGNLGLFVGAGFSMAVMNENGGRPIALNWTTLLSKVGKKYAIDVKKHISDGQSLPELASKLIQHISDVKKLKFNEVALEFKKHIATLTTYYPNEEARTEYGEYLEALDPSWIITTNYDLVLECLLPGKCLPLSPTEQLMAPKGIIPIYHLHGIKSVPSSIVITQEDYISLFRPNEYRHTKLPLTIKESTTLVLGYGLNDINVLTAVDWSKNVFSSTKINYPHEIFQVLYKGEEYQQKPYRNKDGIIIIEVENLPTFFEELSFDLDIERRSHKKLLKELNKINSEILNADNSQVEKFVKDEKYRKELLDMLVEYESYMISAFVDIFSKGLDYCWEKSRGNKAFYAYDWILEILLDVIINIPLEKLSPILLEIIANSFSSVCQYIGDYYGMSWEGLRLWNNHKAEIPEATILELYHIANNQKYYNMIQFLKDHFDESDIFSA